MAITTTVVYAKSNHVRLLVVATAGSGESSPVLGGTILAALQAAGAAGPLVNIFQVGTQGYGKLVAGVVSAPQAAALLCSDNALTVVGANVPTALMAVQQRTGTGTMTAAAVQDATTLSPGLTIAAAAAGAASCYVDIYIPGSIGV